MLLDLIFNNLLGYGVLYLTPLILHFTNYCYFFMFTGYTYFPVCKNSWLCFAHFSTGLSYFLKRIIRMNILYTNNPLLYELWVYSLILRFVFTPNFNREKIYYLLPFMLKRNLSSLRTSSLPHGNV